MMQVALPSGVLAAGAFLVPCLLCMPRRGPGEVLVILLAAVAAVRIGQHHGIVQRHLRQHPRQRWALLLGCSFLLSWMALGDLIFAHWWVMDDHEVVQLLGSDHRLSLAEMFQSLREHPEVGQLGAGPRARPSYYVLRHLETWLWGDNLALWYLARVVVLGGIFALCWDLLWRWVGGIDAGLLMLMIFCWRMWADLWSRIGSSETYAMLGMALSLLGVVLLERRAARSAGVGVVAWWLIVCGAAIAMGCKENFLILVPATVAYAVWLWQQRRLDLFAVCGTLAVTALGMCLVWAVVGSLAADSGIDIYARERSVGGLLAASVRCLTVHFGAVMLAVIGGLVVFARRIGGDPRLARLLPQTKATIWALLGLLALFVSQFAFYENFNLFSNRYAFPAALAPLLMLPLVGRLRIRYRRITGGNRHGIRRTQLAFRAALVTLVALMGLTMQRHATRHVRQTAAFTGQLQRLARTCATDPGQPLVFVSHRPMDYESLYSVARFLRYYQVGNPLYLQLAGYDGQRYPQGLDGALTRELQSVSRDGDEVFRPLDELPAVAEPLAVSFSAQPAARVCVAEFPCWK
jgi:hypothetical protein